MKIKTDTDKTVTSEEGVPHAAQHVEEDWEDDTTNPNPCSHGGCGHDHG